MTTVGWVLEVVFVLLYSILIFLRGGEVETWLCLLCVALNFMIQCINFEASYFLLLLGWFMKAGHAENLDVGSEVVNVKCNRSSGNKILVPVKNVVGVAFLCDLRFSR